MSFESVSQPGAFIRHTQEFIFAQHRRRLQVYVEEPKNELYKEESSFQIITDTYGIYSL